MNKVVAVLCSDIHIENCPSWRSAEADWFEAMARNLRELKQVAQMHSVPVVCAGDIFTRWNASPELVNFAIDNLPVMYSVRGNHDLPIHRHEEFRKSAYCTLVEAGMLVDLTDIRRIPASRLVLVPFPWGKPVVPLTQETKKNFPENSIFLAVVHQYIWKEGSGYTGAPEEQKVKAFQKSLKGYHASVWGDNHKGFIINIPGTHALMNCGTVFRRHADEINYCPHIGLLHEDGMISPYYLDISKDVHIQDAHVSTIRDETDTMFTLQQLKSLSQDSLDFKLAVRRTVQGLRLRDACDESVERLVLSAIED